MSVDSDAGLWLFEFPNVFRVAGRGHVAGVLEYFGGMAVVREAEQGLRAGRALSACAPRQKQQVEAL